MLTRPVTGDQGNVAGLALANSLGVTLRGDRAAAHPAAALARHPGERHWRARWRRRWRRVWSWGWRVVIVNAGWTALACRSAALLRRSCSWCVEVGVGGLAFVGDGGAAAHGRTADADRTWCCAAVHWSEVAVMSIDDQICDAWSRRRPTPIWSATATPTKRS